jgi:hypothetical protein
MTTRYFWFNIVGLLVAGWFIGSFCWKRWLTYPEPKINTTLKQLPPMRLAHPELLQTTNTVVFKNAGEPNDLTKPEELEILHLIGRIPNIDYSVSQMDFCWADTRVAARVRVSDAIIFLVKDSSDSWSLSRVIRVRY